MVGAMDMDSYRLEVCRKIERHGWVVQGVMVKQPAYYTVGLGRLGHPELTIAGLPPESAATILNGLGGRVNAGEQFADDTRITGELEHDLPLLTQEIPQAALSVFKVAAWWYRGNPDELPDGTQLRVMQVFWPDDRGRLPGEPGCRRSVIDAQRLAL
jgi:hypothetical protein